MKKPWFEVDKQGLAEIVERRGGKAWLVQELLANSWDEPNVTKVDVCLEPVDNSPTVEMTVTDDAPQGFQDLSHAWTLFAKSAKRGDAEKRGRFNLGEKLFLAFCKEASITTTAGTVMFDQRGRTFSGKTKRESGSEVFGVVRMTREELDCVRKDLRRLIPPEHIKTTIDGVVLENRKPLATFEAVLWTELPDEETGALARRCRVSKVRVFRPLEGETPMLYELGIPVVELSGDPLHIDVRQKVPLNLERDNVTPSYLKDLRSAVLTNLHAVLQPEEMHGSWANDAMASYETPKVAIESALTARFGAQRVSADPSDREAENKLKAEGYTIVHGGSLPAEVWDRVRQTGAMQSAGSLSPTPKAYSQDGAQMNIIEFDRLSRVTQAGVLRYRAVCRVLLGREIAIVCADEPQWRPLAVWHQGRSMMVLNVGKLRDDHFIDDAAVYAIALHEIAHEREVNHLSENYHDEICRLAGQLVVANRAGKIDQQIDLYDKELRS